MIGSRLFLRLAARSPGQCGARLCEAIATKTKATVNSLFENHSIPILLYFTYSVCGQFSENCKS